MQKITNQNLWLLHCHLTFLILYFYRFSSQIILVSNNITVTINLFSIIDLISKKSYQYNYWKEDYWRQFKISLSLVSHT